MKYPLRKPAVSCGDLQGKPLLRHRLYYVDTIVDTFGIALPRQRYPEAGFDSSITYFKMLLQYGVGDILNITAFDIIGNYFLTDSEGVDAAAYRRSNQHQSKIFRYYGFHLGCHLLPHRIASAGEFALIRFEFGDLFSNIANML